MKSVIKNILYSITLDDEILEYKVRNVLMRGLFDLLKLNSQITLPVNQIAHLTAREALLGNLVSFTILKHSTRKGARRKKLRLKNIWLFNKEALKFLQHNIIFKSSSSNKLIQMPSAGIITITTYKSDETIQQQ